MASPLFSRISAELRRFPRAVLPIVTPITVALGDGPDVGVSGATETNELAKSNEPTGEASQQVNRARYSESALDVSDADDGEARIDSDEQWERVTKVLDATILGAEKAEWAHLSAQEQLDAGDYEFASLVDDLQGLVSGLADVVAVHAAETPADDDSGVGGAEVDNDADRHLHRVEGADLGRRARETAMPGRGQEVPAKKPVAA